MDTMTGVPFVQVTLALRGNSLGPKVPAGHVIVTVWPGVGLVELCDAGGPPYARAALGTPTASNAKMLMAMIFFFMVAMPL
jgi:hypothetical protein